MSEERARLWEAWAISLDDPEWAERVRNELDFLTPTSARDMLLQLLSRGPNLYELCRQLGLNYTWIAVEDEQTPQRTQVRELLQAARSGINLVHCFAGQGRTGLFVAAYRMDKGEPPEQAIARTDGEIFSRGMREGQRQWLRENLCTTP